MEKWIYKNNENNNIKNKNNDVNLENNNSNDKNNTNSNNIRKKKHKPYINPFFSFLECQKYVNKFFNKKYNYKSRLLSFNEYILSQLLYNKNTHLVSVFKDYMIYDYKEEFLRRYYKENETFERLPKFSNFYKNYLKFFLKPTFNNLCFNEIIQDYSEKKAEIFYNQNFRKKNENNPGYDDGILEDSESDVNYNNISKSKIETTIFKNTLKNSIDNITNISNENKKCEENTRTITLTTENELNINN